MTVIEYPITSKQLVKTVLLFLLNDFEWICFATDLCLSGYLTEVNKNKRQIWIIATALSITSNNVPIGQDGFQVVVDMPLPDDLTKIKYVLGFFQTFELLVLVPLLFVIHLKI